ncbi:hypothetical protein HYZ64_03235 [Candidatus Berkelbacteria bacterium]|nr:hypothetical protein [Candidatus Berkelbacteria bacterium]
MRVVSDIRRVKRLVPPPHLAPYVTGSSFDFASLQQDYRVHRTIPWRSLFFLALCVMLLVVAGRILPQVVTLAHTQLQQLASVAEITQTELESGVSAVKQKQFGLREAEAVEHRAGRFDRRQSIVRNACPLGGATADFIAGGLE